VPFDPPVIQRLQNLGVDPRDLRPFFSPQKKAQRLCLPENRLSLCDARGQPVLVVDFLTGSWRHRAAGHLRGELLIKAVFGRHKASAGPLRVIDATAGLGRDSLLLALAGARVQAFERHPVLHALLLDGLWRASQEPLLAAAVARIDLQKGDFRQLASQSQPADVIYLDPMFPARQKSAKVKKDMQALHRLVGVGQDDADALLRVALHQPVAKVVVKRPKTAVPLAAMTPTSQVVGKSSRFDTYAISMREQE
jgi:16S rRNA (guanine1516-N2)-methyltransferase